MGGFRALADVAGDTLAVIANASVYGIALSFLASLFLVSGASKLRRPRLAAIAMVNFGVARRARPGYGRALAVAEITLASLLVIRLEPRVMLIAAGVLLWAFSALIARALLSGERFPCHCFGESDSALNVVTLARTATLALVATAFAAAGEHGAVASAASEAGALEAAGAISVLGMIALASRLRQLVVWNRLSLLPRARAAE
jgi:hypothetical protein